MPQRLAWPQLYNPVKGSGNMVVSNRDVNSSNRSTSAWQWLRHSWLQSVTKDLERLRKSLYRLSAMLPLLQHAKTQTGGVVRYVTMPQHQTDYLLERSTLLFRRENQSESFDDDVSALRDQVGAGRRDQAEQEQEAAPDQTTYSPPRQSWDTVSTSAEATSYEPAVQTAARQPAEAGDASVIAPDTRWDGTVQSSGALHIYGSVGGQISADGDVYVAEGAAVTADVRAGSVTVAGSLEGTVECSGRFEVLPSGRVSADVAAPRLVVHEGAVVIGKLHMTSDQNNAG